MKTIERFSDLMFCSTLDEWRERVFALGSDFGYERVMLAILPSRSTPVESKFAFQHSNYAPAWLNKYDEEKMGYGDPTVAHIMSKTTPLIWSPEVFSRCDKNEMYEEAGRYGLRSGVSLPVHGANGELGIMCFASDARPGSGISRHIASTLPKLSYLRDFILESSTPFRRRSAPDRSLHITTRELECLKWGAAGKSSWEIGRILNCSEATVNFHFGNIRFKLDSKTRQQAVVKAIRLGLIAPA